MAAVVQTALKNNLLSAYYSAQQISSDSFQTQQIKYAIAMISFFERTLLLTPVNPTASVTVRTETELITFLSSILISVEQLVDDADYSDVPFTVVEANISAIIEYYRVFVN